MAEGWAPGYQMQGSFQPVLQKPKVGFGVVCRCPGSGVQCLLQKRGLNSSSPNKWSFPGGRLENPGDLDEDGDVGTRRELEEECGGGEPLGLPSLIHIECYKSGKVKQTIYHVYAVDTSTNKEWECWKPKPKAEKGSEVDTLATELVVNNQSFPSQNGYCWVDMHALIQECDKLTSASHSDMLATDLQHGLVRWVQNYGDHILRTLIQRSPKLPHHSPRRHSSSSTSSSSGTNGVATKPRSKAELQPKPQRYRTPELLQPPFAPLRPPTAFQAPANHSPTHNFYGLGLMAPLGHMSPSMAASGLVNNQQGMLMRIPTLLPTSTVAPQPIVAPPQGAHSGMMYLPQLGMQPSPSLDSPSGTTGLVLQGPPESSGKEGGSSSLSLSGGSGITTESSGGSTNAEIISKLMHPASAFHQVSSQHPSSSFPEQPQGGSVVGTLPLQLASTGHAQTHTVSVAAHQDHHHPQVPPNLPHFPLGTNVAAPVDHTEALLPIPQVVPSITPLTATVAHTPHPQTPPLGHRKEILCRYFIAGHGHCPYGEKCWFAHPEPLGQITHGDFATLPQTTIPSSPLHIQVPSQPHVWNPSLPNVPVPYLTSPPQSPLGGYLASTDPSGMRTPILHPTPPYSFPGQSPILVWGRGPRNFPLLPSVRPPVPVHVPVDPMLRFSLLAEVVVHSDSPDRSGPIRNISQLTARADHFFVSFENKVHDYKILFSGHHSHQESWILQDLFEFQHKVTCIHSCRQYQHLLLVGTEAGHVHFCTLRKGNQYNQSSSITPICNVEPSAPVTSLVHFSTSITMAQVVVVGTQKGTVSWYISQPPQKTFSLLFSDRPHYPHDIVSLQVWGGLLVSGSREGKLIVWSMSTQQPVIHSEQQVHSASLSSIHIQDSSAIITVGRGSSVQGEKELTTSAVPVSASSLSLSTMSVLSTGTDNTLSTLPQEVLSNGSTPGVSLLAQDMSQLGVSDTTATRYEDTVTLWQYGVPLRPTKIQGDLGEIVTSVFHQAHTGNMFLAIGLCNGTIKILNLPNFSVASELRFPEMAGKCCLHMALNLSRESPIQNHNYYRYPFRDLILTTVWSDGKIMICQVLRQ